MRPQGVVFVDVLVDCLTQFTGGTELVDVDHLGFQTEEPAFDHDVVRPAGLAVHTLTDVQRFEKCFVLGAGELAALVGIENRGNAEVLHSYLNDIQNRRGFQGIGQLPAQNFPAEPVNNRRQVHMAVGHFNVRDIDRPHLILE